MLEGAIKKLIEPEIMPVLLYKIVIGVYKSGIILVAVGFVEVI
jgi:hypothetical protein